SAPRGRGKTFAARRRISSAMAGLAASGEQGPAKTASSRLIRSRTPALTLQAPCSHPDGMQDPTPEQIDAFVERWQHSGGHETLAGLGRL
ncbi:MAG: hypothetical protein KDN05_20960, partial [Verrucomicrobiae bacterium]|nr:hypothetical protein [Verrucomicrobiae bacterium]